MNSFDNKGIGLDSTKKSVLNEVSNSFPGVRENFGESQVIGESRVNAENQISGDQSLSLSIKKPSEIMKQKFNISNLESNDTMYKG